MSTVEYRECIDYPSYKFGTDGSFWSNHRKGWQRIYGSPDKDGYTQFVLQHQDGTPHTIKAHRLLLILFKGQSEDSSLFALHKNDVKWDNVITNLYWGTPKQNSLDMIVNGNSQKGIKNYQTGLTEDNIRMIRHRYKTEKVSIYQLAREYCVSKSSIHNIIKYKTWAHVK